MSLISLMLFVTIVALSSGLGFKNSMESSLKATTPFNGTLQLLYTGDSKPITMEQALKVANITIPQDYEKAFYNTYDSGVKLSALTGNSKYSYNVDVIPVSEYNKVMKLERK